jgi:IclR family transcriptional regulator, pca regulon regulatory protein
MSTLELDDRTMQILGEPRFSQSLAYGLAILARFTPDRPILGIADIADEMGMSRSTTHRYVITLVALGYLEQGARRKYHLGLRVTDLGMAVLNSTGLRQHAREYLEDLRSRTGFTISLAILDGDTILFMDRLRSQRRSQVEIEYDTAIGVHRPVHATALGKMLVASLPDRDRDTLVSQLDLTRHTRYTIASRKVLRTELQTVRDTGFATSNQELFPELVAIAAPIRNDAREVVAAVGLSANRKTISLEELVEGLSPHVISAAGRISERLGFRIGEPE